MPHNSHKATKPACIKIQEGVDSGLILYAMILHKIKRTLNSQDNLYASLPRILISRSELFTNWNLNAVRDGCFWPDRSPSGVNENGMMTAGNDDVNGIWPLALQYRKSVLHDLDTWRRNLSTTSRRDWSLKQIEELVINWTSLDHFRIKYVYKSINTWCAWLVCMITKSKLKIVLKTKAYKWLNLPYSECSFVFHIYVYKFFDWHF